MKNWKRIAALAMSAVMVGGMLTGCGGGGGSTEAAKDNGTKGKRLLTAGRRSRFMYSSVTGATCLTGTAWRPEATAQ